MVHGRRSTGGGAFACNQTKGVGWMNHRSGFCRRPNVLHVPRQAPSPLPFITTPSSSLSSSSSSSLSSSSSSSSSSIHPSNHPSIHPSIHLIHPSPKPHQLILT